MIHRRQFLSGCLQSAAAASFLRCLQATESSNLPMRIDAALQAAVQFLARKQADDGAWRSEIYGPFKDGPSLTSLIASTLSELPDDASACQAGERARRYLAKFVSDDGSIVSGLNGITYPVYTAAGSVTAMQHGQWRGSAAQMAWLNYLRERQLTDDLGWARSDLAYGGWSYAPDRPRPVDGKPPTPLAAPNLSATVFALDALRAAGFKASHPTIQKARVFVDRCQNWSDDPDLRDTRFDDGGFFFILQDPQRNKAGEAGTDQCGRTRYASYGSSTADGLRALIACGLPSDHPRVVAARNWLVANFSVDQHPGAYSASREHLRPAVYYYYSSSAARAFRCTGGKANWGSDLAEAMLSRQHRDGYWANPVVEIREDDPLVATSLAVQTLISCKAAIVTG